MTSPLRIVVTRPSPYGEQLCRLLEHEGFNSAHHPLIRFSSEGCATPEQRLNQLQQSDTWIFVSRQAVNFCFNNLSAEQLQQLQQRSQRKCLIAVGPATAESLQEQGFSALIPDTPDSEGMIQLIQDRQLQTQTTVLIRGNQGRELLQKFFAPQQISILQVYQRLTTNQQIPASSSAVSAIIATSGQLLELIAKQVTPLDSNISIIAGSERIHEMAQHIGFTNCYTAKNASNSELVKSCILWRNNVS